MLLKNKNDSIVYWLFYITHKAKLLSATNLANEAFVLWAQSRAICLNFKNLKKSFQRKRIQRKKNEDKWSTTEFFSFLFFDPRLYSVVKKEYPGCCVYDTFKRGQLSLLTYTTSIVIHLPCHHTNLFKYLKETSLHQQRMFRLKNWPKDFLVFPT